MHQSFTILIAQDRLRGLHHEKIMIEGVLLNLEHIMFIHLSMVSNYNHLTELKVA